MFKTVNLKCTGTYCTLYCTTTGNSALPPAHGPAGVDIGRSTQHFLSHISTAPDTPGSGPCCRACTPSQPDPPPRPPRYHAKIRK